MKLIKKMCFIALIGTLLPSLCQAQDLKKGPLEIETINNRHYLLVADSILDRDILVQTTVSKAPAMEGRFYEKGFRKHAISNNATIRFIKDHIGRIRIVNTYYSKKNKAEIKSLFDETESNVEFPIRVIFDKVESTKHGYSKVDFTETMFEDNAFMGIRPIWMEMVKLESIQKEKSFFVRQERFSEGMDLRISKTYDSEKTQRTIELNTSFLLLSKTPMNGRLADERVTSMEFNTVPFTDYSVNPQFAVERKYANRFRLEPSPQDRANYLKGKLVKPMKPIVFYLDPSISEKWIPYYKAGLLMWEKTFERAGFKDAMQIKIASNSEKDFNVHSLRYNIVYEIPSADFGGNAYSMVDPRSGEVVWASISIPSSNSAFHRNRVMVLTGAYDTAVRKAELPFDVAGEINAAVIAHEMGHTLGIHHNFLSSALVPVEKLREKKWVEKNGFSPSIMDYARHNYVAQPEDNMGGAARTRSVGVYDYWAVEWLYTWYDDNDPELEKKRLDSLYKVRLAADPLIQYLKTTTDYRVQSEDVGDNGLIASQYGLKNIKYMVPHILDWTRTEEGSINPKVANEVYLEAINQLGYFIEHVAGMLGGVTIELNESELPQVGKAVSKGQQKKIIEFLGEEYLKTPEWLLDPRLVKALNHSWAYQPESKMANLQSLVLRKVLSSSVFLRLRERLQVDPHQYQPKEMLQDVGAYVFGEWEKGEAVTFPRQNLQNNFVMFLKEAVKYTKTYDYMQEDIFEMHKYFDSIKERAYLAISKTKDGFTIQHLKKLIQSIEN